MLYTCAKVRNEHNKIRKQYKSRCYVEGKDPEIQQEKRRDEKYTDIDIELFTGGIMPFL